MNPTVNFYGDELPHKEEINKQSICNTRFVASAHSGVKRFERFILHYVPCSEKIYTIQKWALRSSKVHRSQDLLFQNDFEFLVALRLRGLGRESLHLSDMTRK